MRLVLISDTHGLHTRMPAIPDGDVLVHAGDLTATSTMEETAIALDWLSTLPHPHKSFVAGNHDFVFELQPLAAEALVPAGVTHLRDSATEIGGLRFWGSPWQPEFHQWPFNLPRGEPLARVWAQIPQDTQVLVTHGPPRGILDRVVGRLGKHEGCDDLRRRVAELRDLRLHVFGHIHEGYGSMTVGNCRYVNASTTTVT
jgi:predicted phosphohydrolase